MPPFDFVAHQSSYSEIRRWPVEVFRAEDGSEQRVLSASAAQPQRAVRARYDSTGYQSADRIEEAVRASLGDSSPTDVPLWWSYTRMTAATSASATTIPVATAGREFLAGGRVMVWSGPGESEVRTVATVGASSITITAGLTDAYPTGTVVVPVIRSWPDDAPGFRWGLGWLYSVAMRFDEATQATGVFMFSEPDVPSFQSYPVLDFAQHGNGRLSIERPAVLTGQRWQTRKRYLPEVDRIRASVETVQETASQRAAIRGFVDDREGMASPFWCPVDRGELRVLGPGNDPDLINVELSRAWREELVTGNRAVWFPRIQKAAFLLDYSEPVAGFGLIQVSEDLADDILPGDRIQLLPFVRFDQEEFALQSRPDLGEDISSMAFHVVEVRQEQPEHEA